MTTYYASATTMFGTAKADWAFRLKAELERNGWTIDEFRELKGGKWKYHASRTPQRAGITA